MMKFSIRGVAAAAMATGVLLAMSAGTALAVPVFTIDSSAIPSSGGGTTIGDLFAGTSSELLTTTGNSHTGSGWLQLTSLNLLGSPVKFFGAAANTYGLYVTFNLTDTYSSGGGGVDKPGSVNDLSVLDFSVWADPTHDDLFTPASTSGLTGTNATYTNGANDILLGFGSLVSGTDGFDSLGGAYLNSIESFALCTGSGTATVGGIGILNPGCTDGTGKALFVNPDPFYTLAFTEFNNTTQGPTRSTDGKFTAITQATGGVDFNNVPEPGSMALFGLALAGLGVAARRGKKGSSV